MRRERIKGAEDKGPNAVTALPVVPPCTHGAGMMQCLPFPCYRNDVEAKGPGPPALLKGEAGPESQCPVRDVQDLRGHGSGGERVERALAPPLLAEACLPSESRGLRMCGLGMGQELVPLTYKQGMYTRLPTITSMNSSGEQSSRKSTSALKISEGLRLRANWVLVAPSAQSDEGLKQLIRKYASSKGPCRSSAHKVLRNFKVFSKEATICKSFNHQFKSLLLGKKIHLPEPQSSSGEPWASVPGAVRKLGSNSPSPMQNSPLGTTLPLPVHF